MQEHPPSHLQRSPPQPWQPRQCPAGHVLQRWPPQCPAWQVPLPLEQPHEDSHLQPETPHGMTPLPPCLLRQPCQQPPCLLPPCHLPLCQQPPCHLPLCHLPPCQQLPCLLQPCHLQPCQQPPCPQLSPPQPCLVLPCNDLC